MDFLNIKFKPLKFVKGKNLFYLFSYEESSAKDKKAHASHIEV